MTDPKLNPYLVKRLTYDNDVVKCHISADAKMGTKWEDPEAGCQCFHCKPARQSDEYKTT